MDTCRVTDLHGGADGSADLAPSAGVRRRPQTGAPHLSATGLGLNLALAVFRTIRCLNNEPVTPVS